jgi:hypothetical protein
LLVEDARLSLEERALQAMRDGEHQELETIRVHCREFLGTGESRDVDSRELLIGSDQ